VATAEWHGILVYRSNIPRSKAGVYLLTNTVNGKQYVGIGQDIAKRIRQHFATSSGSTRLGRAIAKYGVQSFIAEPIYYSTTGTDGLPEIEANLIASYATVASGYNIVAAYGGVGPYGEKFAQIIRDSQRLPEVRLASSIRMKARMADPEQRKLIAEWSTLSWLDPVIRARRLDGLMSVRDVITGKATAQWLRPEVRQRTLDAMRAAGECPELRKRVSDTSRVRAATPAGREHLSRIATEAMANPTRLEQQSKRVAAIWADKDRRAKLLAAKKLASDSAETRARMSASAKARWADPQKKPAFAANIATAASPAPTPKPLDPLPPVPTSATVGLKS
jgi:hypothetical protein